MASDDSAQPRSTMAHNIKRSASLRYLSCVAGDSCNESQACTAWLSARSAHARWGARKVHLNGRYAFRGSGQALDLDAIIQGLDLE